MYLCWTPWATVTDCSLLASSLPPVAQLLLARDDELANRVVRIVPVDECQVIVVRPEDILAGDGFEALEEVGRNVGDLVQPPDILHTPLVRRRFISGLWVIHGAAPVRCPWRRKA